MGLKDENVCKQSLFETLFEKIAGNLRNYIYYKSGQLERAEDIVQEAFVKLWENCKKVSPEKAQSYLFTVATNTLLNLIEKDKVRFKFKPNTKADFETPEFALEYDEYKTKLEKALNGLPDGQREVFLLNRIDKLTYKEIAEQLNLSVKAVEKRMSLALKHMKETVFNKND